MVFVVGLLIAGFVGLALAAYVADRVLKARTQARRLRTMRDRLAAATRRAEEQQAKRAAAAQASAALTSVMPAIERPPLTLPGVPPRGPAHGQRRPQASGTHTGPHDRRSAHPGAPVSRDAAARSGPHQAAARAPQDEPHRT
jgi:hypothetical protein